MHKLIGILSFPRSSKREEAGVGDYSSNCLLSIDHFDPISVLFKMEKVWLFRYFNDSLHWPKKFI